MTAEDSRNVPLFPVLRYLLAAWGLVVATFCCAASAASVGGDPAGVVIPLVLAGAAAWVARRWWQLGVVVRQDVVVVRGLWGRQRFARKDVVGVRIEKRTRGLYRRTLTRGVVLDTTGGGTARLGGAGIAFSSDLMAEPFVKRLRAALGLTSA